MWERPSEASSELISHYQLFLNRVSYKHRIRPDATNILVKGLCGGRSYEISLMVFPKSQSHIPQQSNILVFNAFLLFFLLLASYLFNMILKS